LSTLTTTTFRRIEGAGAERPQRFRQRVVLLMASAAFRRVNTASTIAGSPPPFGCSTSISRNSVAGAAPPSTVTTSSHTFTCDEPSTEIVNSARSVCSSTTGPNGLRSHVSARREAGIDRDRPERLVERELMAGHRVAVLRRGQTSTSTPGRVRRSGRAG
jgi:hypothetical protein